MKSRFRSATRDYRNIPTDYAIPTGSEAPAQEEVNESCKTGLELLVLFGQALLLAAFIGVVFIYGLPFISIWMDK